jgi:hypothetical protein
MAYEDFLDLAITYKSWEWHSEIFRHGPTPTLIHSGRAVDPMGRLQTCAFVGKDQKMYKFGWFLGFVLKYSETCE